MLAPDTYPTKKKKKEKKVFYLPISSDSMNTISANFGRITSTNFQILIKSQRRSIYKCLLKSLVLYVYCVTKFGLYIEINRRNMMVLQKRWGRQKLTSLLILQFLPNLNYKCISSGNNFRSHIFHSTFMQMPFPEHILKICHGLGAWNEWTTKTRWKGALRKKSQDPKRISYEHWKRKSSRERL